MKKRVLSTLVLSSLVAACAPPSPPALAYRVPATPDVVYEYADTSVVSVSVMGQILEMSQRGVGTYGVGFASSPEGVRVTLTVQSLDASLAQPMGASVRVDEGDVDGALVFTLGRRGEASLVERPDVEAQASLMVSAMSLAHTFFPRLPGRAVAPGESWTDTIAFSGQETGGDRSERSVVRYTVTGDTIVSGRPLLVIALDATTESSNTMVISGMSVSQRSDLDVTGTILWDHQRGLLVESVRRARGAGTASVPIAPAPLPIRIESTQRVRLLRSGSQTR
jgi:hypothetical protein